SARRGRATRSARPRRPRPPRAGGYRPRGPGPASRRPGRSPGSRPRSPCTGGLEPGCGRHWRPLLHPASGGHPSPGGPEARRSSAATRPVRSVTRRAVTTTTKKANIPHTLTVLAVVATLFLVVRLAPASWSDVRRVPAVGDGARLVGPVWQRAWVTAGRTVFGSMSRPPPGYAPFRVT